MAKLNFAKEFVADATDIVRGAKGQIKGMDLTKWKKKLFVKVFKQSVFTKADWIPFLFVNNIGIC